MPNSATSACVLIIGNEILSGRTQDANLNHIALTLNEWGVQVREARVVPDVAAIIVDTLNEVRARFDYVLTTGGIGPTHDDITAVCIARAFDRPIVIHPDIEAVIRSRPAEPEIMAARMLMARVPEGATLIDNPTGGPQGFQIENVFVMAGIPAVMRAMLSTLADRLRGHAPVRTRNVTVHAGESTIAGPLGELQRAHPDVDIGSYPFFREGVYGTTLVLRSPDEARLDTVRAALVQMLATLDLEPVPNE